MSDGYVESSGTPVVILRLPTINNILSVMFGYCLKVEDQKVFGARQEKNVIFKVVICTGCNVNQWSQRVVRIVITLSTGKGILAVE